MLDRKLINCINVLLSEATDSIYDIEYHDGKRVRKRKKRDKMYQEPHDAKDNVSLSKARLYANTAGASMKRDKSMLARQFRDSIYT